MEARTEANSDAGMSGIDHPVAKLAAFVLSLDDTAVKSVSTKTLGDFSVGRVAMPRISLLDRARTSNAAMLLASTLAVMPALGWTGAANAQEQVEIEWATWGWAEPVFQEVA